MSAPLIFTDLERQARHNAMLKRWRRKHPDKEREYKRRYKAKQRIYTARWKKNNPDQNSLHVRRSNRRLSRASIAHRLIRRGIDITDETIEKERSVVRAIRSRELFRMIYATSKIAK